jgi:hypothetical protein
LRPQKVRGLVVGFTWLRGIVYKSNGSKTANSVKGFLVPPLASVNSRAIQYLGGLTDRAKVLLTLYIKLEVGQAIKGDIEKIYLVCYPILEEKETSCKEIGWGHATQIHSDRRFL